MPRPPVPITFQPPGQGLILSFNTPLEDGFDNASPLESHFIPLVSQGVFGSFERSTAYQKVFVLADETVQGTSGPLSGLDVIVELTRGSSTGSAGVRVNFSGYIEDLPAAAAVR